MANPKKNKRMIRLWLTEQQVKDLKEDLEILIRVGEEGDFNDIDELDEARRSEEEIIQIIFNTYKEGFFEL